MSAQYPSARWIPAARGNYRVPTPLRSNLAIDLIVVHITDGGATRAEQTARWFANPNQRNNKGKAIAVSAHYIVGRRGNVVQCVRHEHIAHHAGSANARSIGIEHVVPHSESGLTDAQYNASTALIRWLCSQTGIPADPQHVRGHSHVDRRTTHRTCPDRAFNWTNFWTLMRLTEPFEQSFDDLISELAQ